jgi:hypothetical protein
MKRSLNVTAPLLATAALSLLAACKRQPEMQRCVDENNRVVDQSFCKNLPPAPANGVSGGAYIPYPSPYRYYYGGGGGYGTGSVVTGGDYAPITGHSYSATSGTARGGFGSSHGGGGEGGGE